MISRARLSVFSLGYWIRHKFPIRHMTGPWIFTRTACFGNDIVNLTYPHVRQVRAQKIRSDSLADVFAVPKDSVRVKVSLNVRKLIRMPEMLPLFLQQNLRILPKVKPPEFVLIDSYSDLTDQAFRDERNGTIFYSHYSDLREDRIHREGIKPLGLLDLSTLQEYMEIAISKVRLNWGGVPIIFLTYPTVLEDRESYRQRAKVIKNIFSKLAEENVDIHFLDFTGFPAEPSADDLEAGRIYPYHYSPNVYHEAARGLREIVSSQMVL